MPSDANECDEGSASCDLNADCVNTQGSYTCTCKVGYSGDGIYCTSKHCRFNFCQCFHICLLLQPYETKHCQHAISPFPIKLQWGSGLVVRASHCLLRELRFDAEVGEVLKCK